MLRVNVGMSRKLSKDYNSTGFSVNLEGEVCVSLDDPEAVVEKIKELYDVAEESLAQQIDRYEGDSAIAGRDQEPPHVNSQPAADARSHQAGNGYRNGNGRNSNGNGNANGRQQDTGTQATNKQIQFLLSIAKRQGLTKPQIEGRIAEILGREIGLYDLTKQEAGIVLDSFTADYGSRARR